MQQTINGWRVTYEYSAADIKSTALNETRTTNVDPEITDIRHPLNIVVTRASQMLVFLFHTMFYIIVGDNFNCQPSRLWLPLAISGAMSFCRCWCHNCEHVRVKAMCFKFTHADYYAADIFVCTDKTALNLCKTKPILFGNDRVRTVCHKTVPSFKSPTSRIRLSTFSALSHRIYGTKT